MNTEHDTPFDAPAVPAPGQATWRHPVNVGQLVVGTALAGAVLIWALIVGEVVEDDDLRWLLPIPWVAAGVAGLVAMALTARRRSLRR